jgi:hypothetical protein
LNVLSELATGSEILVFSIETGIFKLAYNFS